MREEIELAIEASEATEYGEPPKTESKNFAKIALPEIIPVLLGLMTWQDEDADEDEWNMSRTASQSLMTRVVLQRRRPSVWSWRPPTSVYVPVGRSSISHSLHARVTLSGKRVKN
ncbi:hypothetical protein DFH11DRAFT_1274834 [Phellopilus nigrolimitatus]|nr:hypothetical protein DFH11DRAFT_1274834 [Phellopilus nigrolimitatus]